MDLPLPIINTQKVQENTNRVSQDAQRKLLNDLLRHLYRNYVITYTMRTKMIDIKYKGGPSEEHFIKHLTAIARFESLWPFN